MTDNNKKNKTDEKHELPEICYDEPVQDQKPNPFPFVCVKKGKTMPSVLFIEERKETGEFEVGEQGLPVEIVDCQMRKFVDIELLKERLPADLNDTVRIALGMKPLKQAQALGQKIINRATRNAKNNINKKKEELKKK